MNPNTEDILNRLKVERDHQWSLYMRAKADEENAPLAVWKLLTEAADEIGRLSLSKTEKEVEWPPISLNDLATLLTAYKSLDGQCLIHDRARIKSLSAAGLMELDRYMGEFYAFYTITDKGREFVENWKKVH